ncbi:MAG: hypothetical protein KDJ47_03250 [Hyphomicrobiaceae bacterium]|nr:hypothetical protein [Hyphomicrobiaceae bacterium]
MAIKAKSHRPGGRKTSWRLLTNKDIDQIVAETRLEGVTAEAKTELKMRINPFILDFGAVRDSRRRFPPRQQAAHYKQISIAAKRLQLVLRGADTGLAFEWDRLMKSPTTYATYETLRDRFPETSELMLRAAAEMKPVLQTKEAYDAVRQAKFHAYLLQKLAENAEKTAMSEHELLGRDRRQVDDVRLGLVSSVSHVFHDVLRTQPTATLDGPWIRFLAALLERCEDKPITPESAKVVWQRVREWQIDDQNAVDEPL